MAERPEIDIDKLAILARINLSEKEKEAFSGQLGEILGFFRQLQETDVEGVTPMAHPFAAPAPLREDVPGEPWPPETSLANAPARREDQIVVPKVVEDA